MAKSIEPGSMLRRYQAGEHEAVWADMMALGAAVRQAPYADDARAVARETMRRARHNVELIIPRLDQLGYRFWDGTTGDTGTPGTPLGAVLEVLGPLADEATERWKQLPPRAPSNMSRSIDDLIRRVSQLRSGVGPLLQSQAAAAQKKAEDARRRAAITDHLKDPAVFAPATKEDAVFFNEVEAKGMLVPLSLRAWFEEVGDINLMGRHPALSPQRIKADPLTIFSDSLMNEIDTWLEYHEAGEETGTHEVVLSWDAKDKAQLLADKTELYDYGYIIEIPNGAVDVTLECEPHKTSFVNYLRIAFRWGGFPGWERQENRPEKELKFLTEGLLPI